MSEYLACIVCRDEKPKILNVLLAQITPNVVLLLHAELWEVEWELRCEIVRMKGWCSADLGQLAQARGPHMHRKSWNLCERRAVPMPVDLAGRE